MTLVEVVAYLMAPIGGLAIGLAAYWLATRETGAKRHHPAE